MVLDARDGILSILPAWVSLGIFSGILPGTDQMAKVLPKNKNTETVPHTDWRLIQKQCHDMGWTTSPKFNWGKDKQVSEINAAEGVTTGSLRLPGTC